MDEIGCPTCDEVGDDCECWGCDCGQMVRSGLRCSDCEDDYESIEDALADRMTLVDAFTWRVV